MPGITHNQSWGNSRLADIPDLICGSRHLSDNYSQSPYPHPRNACVLEHKQDNIVRQENNGIPPLHLGYQEVDPLYEQLIPPLLD